MFVGVSSDLLSGSHLGPAAVVIWRFMNKVEHFNQWEAGPARDTPQTVMYQGGHVVLGPP